MSTKPSTEHGERGEARRVPASAPAGEEHDLFPETRLAGEEPEAVSTDEDGEKKKKKKKKKDKKDGSMLGTSRGIETMFRTSYRVNMDLSSLADTKSNIMISINGLIISILLGTISSKIDTNAWLLIPTPVLLIGCLASMVYAVLAARPRVSSRPITLDDVRQNRANILFFGNFSRLSQTEYVDGMVELLQNTDNLYLNMIRDIYGLGLVLQKKFRLLRISYTIFMVALSLGVAVFIVVFAVVVANAPPAAAPTAP